MSALPSFMRPFEGNLSAQELAHGLQLVHDNAKRLVSDGWILFKARRYAAAAELGVASLEESSKKVSLLYLAGAATEKARKFWWTQFRKGEATLPWIDAQRGALSAAEFDDLLRMVKLLGRTTNCIGAGQWTRPNELIGRDLAQEVLRTAEMFSSADAMSQREIEIWTQVCGETKRPDRPETLRKFCDRLESEGFPARAAGIAGLLRASNAAPSVL